MIRLSKPHYIDKFEEIPTEIKLNSGEIINVYTISPNLTDDDKNEWSKHILHHYISDDEINVGVNTNKLSKEDYIKNFVLPSIELRNGGEVAGVFGEIVFSDFIEYILHFKVPRYKFYNNFPGNPNQGIDIVAYRMDEQNTNNDTVLFAEVKARLNNKNFHELQKAINDAEKRTDKDYALILDSARRKLSAMGDFEGAEAISRFSDSESPCKRIKSADLITSANSCSSEDFVAKGKFLGVNIRNGEKIETHVIYAEDLWDLAKDLWRRACL